MLIFLEDINKLYDKLDNHIHHHHHVHHQDESESATTPASASLSAFRSDISTHLNQLASNLKPAGSEVILSFPWIHQCFQILPTIHKSFANLVQDLEYPISKWEANIVDDYLKYTLTLLDLFNSISARLSDLCQARLVLSHALTVVHTSASSAVIDHLEPIEKRSFNRDFNEENCHEDHIKGADNMGKESAIQESLIIMMTIGLWVCGTVISSLYGDEKPYFEMRKLAKKSGFSSLEGLDSSVCEVVKEKNEGGFLKEVREVNEVVSRVRDVIIVEGRIGEEGEEMERRLEVFEKEMDGLGKEVDCVFSGVLNDRSQLLDSIGLNM